MVDETPKEDSRQSGIMMCTFRFFDPRSPRNTKLIVKAVTDIKALKYAKRELGKDVTGLSMEVISYRR